MNIRQMKEMDGRGYNRLARDAGLSPSVVWRVINGETARPSMQTVAKLAEVFGVRTDTIINAIKEEQK